MLNIIIEINGVKTSTIMLLVLTLTTFLQQLYFSSTIVQQFNFLFFNNT